MKKWMPYMSLLAMLACGKSEEEPPPPVPPQPIVLSSITIDGVPLTDSYYGAAVQPLFRARFSGPLLPSTVAAAVQLTNAGGQTQVVQTTLESNDSVLIIRPAQPLAWLSKYKLVIGNSLKSASGGNFSTIVNKSLLTRVDPTPKFPLISDEALLDLVQQQHFRYFWEGAHPVSGLARERSNSGDLVTTGGSGFGIMAMLAAVERGFITRAEALQRLQTITGFLQTRATTYHGAFAHWINGSTGATIPFSTKDNGADLVETSFLIMGLISAREYFDENNSGETALRNAINQLADAVEWDFFRKDGGPDLYWHWSPDYQWEMNMPIRGWNECLVTYLLAASSKTQAIPVASYASGWAANGNNGFLNGADYEGITLPLGPAYGGPLFFAHYSFLGIDPNGLKDQYASYDIQNKAHAEINHRFCIRNPNNHYGYSDSVWGLTASDIPGGYTASSPTNDQGVIAPTAALSSLPYTPEASMKALHYFYYTLGDKLWKEYGFVDAFRLEDPWFADSFLAIDQGPIIVMTENYRSGLLWKLFSGAPEIKAALKKLGFSAPYL